MLESISVAKVAISDRITTKKDLTEVEEATVLDLETVLSWDLIAENVYQLTFKPYFSNHEVVVSFVEAEEMRSLNDLYRNINSVTDVLSFNSIGNLSTDLEKFEDLTGGLEQDAEDCTLGDIVICVSRAREQAIENKHSLKEELAFLFVHGLLHLLGYDHMLADEAEQMFGFQNKILKQHNLLNSEAHRDYQKV